jgi:membrane-associated phospholipid phosphatase
MTNSFIRTIGYYGPIFLIVVAAITLFKRSAHFIAFFIGLVVGHYINETIKTTIRQPRPTGHTERFVGPHIYGMPSSHSQTAIYALTYLFLSKDHSVPRTLFSLTDSIYWLTLAFIAATTLYQRYADRCHTIEQITAGSVLGGGLAMATLKSVDYFRRR